MFNDYWVMKNDKRQISNFKVKLRLRPGFFIFDLAET
jgi:hypothetical protein